MKRNCSLIVTYQTRICRVRTVRENKGKIADFVESKGKSRNFFHGLEKFLFSKLIQGNTFLNYLFKGYLNF